MSAEEGRDGQCDHLGALSRSWCGARRPTSSRKRRPCPSGSNPRSRYTRPCRSPTKTPAAGRRARPQQARPGDRPGLARWGPASGRTVFPPLAGYQAGPGIIGNLRLARQGRQATAPVVLLSRGRVSPWSHSQVRARYPVSPSSRVARKARLLKPRGVQDILNKYAPGAVKLKISPHQLRHSFATDALARGNQIPAVQATLGHRSPATTLMYATSSPADLRRVVERE